MSPDDLRRILKRADTGVATWQEMDLVRSHIAALEKERDEAREHLAQMTLARDMSAAMHEAAQKARTEEAEEHRKALVRSRNEGRRMAIVAVDEAFLADEDVSAQDAIRATMEPE